MDSSCQFKNKKIWFLEVRCVKTSPYISLNVTCQVIVCCIKWKDIFEKKKRPTSLFSFEFLQCLAAINSYIIRSQ